MATLVANLLQFLAHSQQSDHARFFKSWLRRIAPDTHLDLACGSTIFANSPSGVAAPEEHRCRHASKELSQFCGYLYSGTNPYVVHMTGDPYLLQNGDDALAIHSQLLWFDSSPNNGFASRRH
jgi:hypothetical protein